MSEHHGTIHWTELNTHDPEEAKAYYSKLCGWEWQVVPMGDGSDYNLAMKDGVIVAGVFDMSKVPEMAEIPSHWFTYIAVSDLDASIAMTKASGGLVHRDAFDVEGTGRFAIVEDAVGAVFGIMTPNPM